VSQAGALPEVGGEGALYVEPYDAGGFAARLAEVARGEHGGLGDRALARAAQFSWEKTAAETLQVLEEAMAEHRTEGEPHG
jgi:glycosyltransferase involved in cell wall biosynthesis